MGPTGGGGLSSFVVSGMVGNGAAGPKGVEDFGVVTGEVRGEIEGGDGAADRVTDDAPERSRRWPTPTSDFILSNADDSDEADSGVDIVGEGGGDGALDTRSIVVI